MDVRGVHPSLPTYILPTYILPTQSLANLEQGRAREGKERIAGGLPIPIRCRGRNCGMAILFGL